MPQPNHDTGYKLLFSHPRVVEDLLRGFVGEDWVEGLDYTTLEKVSGSYISDDLRDREDDLIWRVRHQGTWLYIYLLLEFQSTVDPWMALRIMVYTGLLYQDLIKSREIKTGEKLPSVFPLVLYNGRLRWTAAREIGELIEDPPGGLKRYHPSQRYFLVEENAVDPAELNDTDNTVSNIIRLETSALPEDVRPGGILAASTPATTRICHPQASLCRLDQPDCAKAANAGTGHPGSERTTGDRHHAGGTCRRMDRTMET